MRAGSSSGGERTPVLYLAPWVDYGGSDKGTIDWFRWLDRERFEPSLICTQPSANRRLAEIELYAREIWALPDLMPAERFPQFIFDFIDSRGIEVLHVMNSRLGFELLPDLASLPRPPRVVVQLHVEEEARDGYVRLVTTRYGNLVDAFSVTSEHLAAAVEGYDVPRGKIEVIYTGVDADDEFHPDTAAPMEIGEEGVVDILFPGRLCAQKDPHLMLDVASALREVEPAFRIHVVGDGELEDDIRASVRARGLEPHVRFHPPTREIARWYVAADVLLMTSVFEGVPYVVYEAMAMGLPIVAPALPGNVELLGPEGGRLVDPRDDVAAYVERVRELVRDRSCREAVGARLRDRARKRLSLRAMAEAHERLYDRLLRTQPLPPHVPRSEPPAPPPPLRFRDRPLRAKPLVSVIVPCFNHGRFLPLCLDSIDRQTYEAIEIIVVDDGSTDRGTRDVLDEIERDGRATVIRLARNTGPSAARNAAIDAAQGRYVLPVDADNLLIEDAVDQLVGQLSVAGEEVGFIYPNLQFFGNRDDYFEPPEYNLHLLLHTNYCDTSALFDRAIFDAGLRFDEDILLGHEDWDFVLTLAERGVRGERARAKTLLYRKHGFSRADAVDHAQTLFHEHVPERHPLLFGDRPHLPPFVSSKARWAPELTLLALRPRDTPPSGGERQSCLDFELLGFSPNDWPDEQHGPALRRLPDGIATDVGERLELGAQAARGRIVVATSGDARELLATRDFVEKAIRVFETHGDLAALAFASGSDGGYAWRPLRSEEAVGDPHTIAWRRRDVVTFDEPLVARPGCELRSLAEALVARGTSLDWRHMSAPSAAMPSDANPGGSPRGMRLGRARSRRRSFFDTAVEVAPALPVIAEPIRRWELTPTWIPPAMTLLCRHRELGSERRITTNNWHSPPGYELEYALGGVRTMPFRGTTRLFALDGDDPRYRAVAVDGDERQPRDATLLGHLELAPLPLLNPVILARHPRTGEELLIGAEDDLLAPEMEHIGAIGFAEPYPIEPRTPARGRQRSFGLRGLVRTVDRARRRHAYGVGETPFGAAPSELGALLECPQLDTEPVWLTDDDVLVTERYRPRLARAPMVSAAKWTLAPLRWPGPWSLDARARGSARRAHDSAAALLRRNGSNAGTPVDAEPCGHLFRRSGHGRIPLYAAVHPVTHDQLLTTHRPEATDMGYEDPLRIGYLVARAPVTGRLGLQAATVPWASRFGEMAERV